MLSHCTKIIFERLTLLYLPVVSYYLWKQKEIEFFDNDSSAMRKNRIKKLVGEKRISRINPIGYVSHECYGTALDNMEKFYKYFTANSTLVREMAGIYQSQSIDMAYKKELTRELSTFYYINAYLHQEGNKLGDNERILFIPYRYHKYLRIVKKSGAFYQSHQRINIASKLNIFNSVDGLVSRVSAWLIQSGIIAYYLIKLVSGRGDGQVKEYEYAIPVRSPDYQLKFKNRSVDFLLNGQEINKENTVFLLLNPAITQDNWEEIKAKKLHVLDCSKPSISSPGFDTGEKARILRKALPYAIRNISLGLFEDTVILDVNNILLPVFFKWSSILRKVSFQHLVTLNDESIDHIGRNILLNKIGVKTWYYAHSASIGYQRIPPRHWLWSFLYYDYYVSWNDERIEYIKLHPQKISNYLTIGCLWSQSIVDVLEGRLTSNLNKEIFTDFERDKYKILAFFDSSYGPSANSPLEVGVTFYRCILKLLEEFDYMLVIVKEKKPPELVLKVYEDFGGATDVFYEQYKPVLKELGSHPRCYMAGYTGDPSEIIAMSDLTITYAFSSSTIEALCAGKRAIFFDPCDRWRGCHYDKIPDFIAHNYEELKYLIHKFLHETSDEEYRDFLNTYVKGKIDSYLDGRAVTRFQKLLAGGVTISPAISP